MAPPDEWDHWCSRNRTTLPGEVAFPLSLLGSAISAWHWCVSKDTRYQLSVSVVQLLSSKFTWGWHKCRFCLCGRTNPVTGLCLGCVDVSQRRFMNNCGVLVTDGEAAEFRWLLSSSLPSEGEGHHSFRQDRGGVPPPYARVCLQVPKHPSLRLRVTTLRETNMLRMKSEKRKSFVLFFAEAKMINQSIYDLLWEY